MRCRQFSSLFFYLQLFVVAVVHSHLWKSPLVRIHTHEPPSSSLSSTPPECVASQFILDGTKKKGEWVWEENPVRSRAKNKIKIQRKKQRRTERKKNKNKNTNTRGTNILIIMTSSLSPSHSYFSCCWLAEPPSPPLQNYILFSNSSGTTRGSYLLFFSSSTLPFLHHLLSPFRPEKGGSSRGDGGRLYNS